MVSRFSKDKGNHKTWLKAITEPVKVINELQFATEKINNQNDSLIFLPVARLNSV